MTEGRKGRPVSSPEKRQEMREKIATVASELFRKEGYEAISMRRLAADVGCTAMSLYQFFPNKFSVLKTLWDDVFKRVFTEVNAVSNSLEPRDRLAEMAFRYVDFWCRNPAEYRLVFMSGDVSQENVGDFMDNHDIVVQYQSLQAELAKVLGADASSEKIGLHFEWLINVLHGTAHNRITISTYPWTDLRAMIDFTIRKIG